MKPIVPIDPFRFGAPIWPDVKFYDKQIEVGYSVWWNDETYVPAGNKLGKDFVAGYLSLVLFLICYGLNLTCRIVTTSVAEHHLKVLWAEIARFLTTSKSPLTADKGGPLVVNYLEIRRADEAHAKNPISYLVGRVSEKGEGLAGHHAEVTLLVADEGSGVSDQVYIMAQGWAKRILAIGNCNPCSNWFRRGIEAGDLLRSTTLAESQTIQTPTPTWREQPSLL